MLNEKYTADIKENELAGLYKSNLESEIQNIEQQLQSLECNETEHKEMERYHEILADIYEQQRKELFQLRKEKFFSDEEIRKAELQLDINDLKITGAGH